MNGKEFFVNLWKKQSVCYLAIALASGAVFGVSGFFIGKSTQNNTSATISSEDSAIESIESEEDFSTSSEVEKEYSEGLRYQLLDNDTYSVTGLGTCTDTHLIIPATYNGKPVSAIGNQAFSGYSNIVDITLPDSITSIGNKAFSDTAYYNNETNWQNGVLYIGQYLIEAKNTVSGKYTINDGTAIIANYAFENSTITEIVIPDSATSIGNAFRGCRSLTSVTIGHGVTSIGDYAFRECSSLTSVTIGNGVTSIGYDAFYYCDNLTYVYYTGTLEDWMGIAFNNTPMFYADNLYINNQLMSEITELVIPDTITEIGEYTFYNWNWLTKVTIPDSVTGIGDRAFWGCGSLTEIVIPDSVTSIGSSAFSGCSSLTSITIGNGVTSIGEEAFSWCHRLTSITFEGTVEEWNAIGYNDWWDVPAIKVICSNGVVSI